MKSISERARSFLSRGKTPSLPALPRNSTTPLAPRAGVVRVTVHCSAHGGATAVECTIDDRTRTLKLGRNLPPGNGSDAGGPPPVTFGDLAINTDGWAGCAVCGTRGWWMCNKPGCGNPIHCFGTRFGMHRCACGIAEYLTFCHVDVVPVSGTKAAAPKNAPALASSVDGALPPPVLRISGK